MIKVKQVLTHRLHVARFAIPLWSMVLALAVVLGSSAQAVGPVLSKSINGTIGAAVGGAGGITVSSAIRLATGVTQAHEIVDADDGVIGVNDDGTGFTAAIEAFENATVKIKLDLVNESGSLAYAIIAVSAPSGVETDAEEVALEVDGVEVARFTDNSWLLKVPAAEDEGDADFQLQISARAGFHTIVATISQMRPG